MLYPSRPSPSPCCFLHKDARAANGEAAKVRCGHDCRDGSGMGLVCSQGDRSSATDGAHSATKAQRSAHTDTPRGGHASCRIEVGLRVALVGSVALDVVVEAHGGVAREERHYQHDEGHDDANPGHGDGVTARGRCGRATLRRHPVHVCGGWLVSRRTLPPSLPIPPPLTQLTCQPAASDCRSRPQHAPT